MSDQNFKQWDGFKTGKWNDKVDVKDFIISNVSSYKGDDSFLAGPTEKTNRLWNQTKQLLETERKANGGVLGMDTRVSTSTAFKAGYIEKELEEIVGIQTEEPLIRAYMPIGGIRVAQKAAQAFGIKTDPSVDNVFINWRKTHNQGVFDAYTPEMRQARHTHIITGLPDSYGRGRIIGDYRRIALYGIDMLIVEKTKEREEINGKMSEKKIRLREEAMEQLRALNNIKVMAASYGFDISKPASNAKEAIQWTYFGYLAAIKEQNGAAMSVGRVSTFFDIYIERDLANGSLTEAQAQELIDHFVMKLRIVRFMRAPEYNELFSGDPVWATETVGGMVDHKTTLVTKSSYRMLHTLSNMGPAPEPNLTVLWSKHLPQNFKNFCSKYSILYSSIQYESDDLMRKEYGCDYGIACCVSPMQIGKGMQFFGARANLAKTLLYAINGGIDELHPDFKMGPQLEQLDINKSLDYKTVTKRFEKFVSWLVDLYVNTLNVIHYMHDKYYYEASEMALCDLEIRRNFATGIAGLSVVADSLSAIKYAKVTPVWTKVEGSDRYIATDFNIEGDFPKYGNDDDKADKIAVDIVKLFDKELQSHTTYRDSIPSASILTITSNVVYGAQTGTTPDGRKAGCPFAPGANPMHGRDCCGAVASLSSVAKIPFKHAADGISNTFSIVPAALGKDEHSKEENLSSLIDAYFKKGSQHLNVNVFNKETLLDAQAHPENYPQLTIRVSGYAVNFVKLNKVQQDDVISRTFHDKI